jgi:hypothetical protein
MARVVCFSLRSKVNNNCEGGFGSIDEVKTAIYYQSLGMADPPPFF